MDGSCNLENGWNFWLLMAPIIMILWLMASGLLMMWWRIVVNPGVTDGKIR